MYESYYNALRLELEIRGYSPKTVKMYSNHLNRFLFHCNKPVESIIVDDIRAYLHYLVSLKLSTSYINGSYSALRLFFIHILNKPFYLFIWLMFLGLKRIINSLLFYPLRK